MISDSMIKLEENYGKCGVFFFYWLLKIKNFKNENLFFKGDSGADNLVENVEKEERKDKEKKKKHRSDRSRSR